MIILNKKYLYRTFLRKNLIRSLVLDSKRYGSRNFFRIFLKDPRFRVNFWLRMGCYLHRRKFISNKLICRHIKNKLLVKYSFDTTFDLQVGYGLRIVHIGSIVIHGNCTIGRNFTILNNVTLGQKNRQSTDVPKVGNNVYIGASTIVLGGIHIEDNVTIGALSLVNKSICRGAIVAGSPARELPTDSKPHKK